MIELARIYCGHRTPNGPVVTVIEGGKTERMLPPAGPEDDPQGWDWANQGAGQWDLGFALLAFHSGPPAAHSHCRAFTREVVANMPPGDWVLPGTQIDTWLTARRQAAAGAIDARGG